MSTQLGANNDQGNSFQPVQLNKKLDYKNISVSDTTRHSNENDRNQLNAAIVKIKAALTELKNQNDFASKRSIVNRIVQEYDDGVKLFCKFNLTAYFISYC